MTGYTMMRVAVKDRAWKTLKNNLWTAIAVSAIYGAAVALLMFFVDSGVNYFTAAGDNYSAIGAGALFGLFAIVLSAPMLAAVLEIFNHMLCKKSVRISRVFSWYTDRDKLFLSMKMALVFVAACIVACIISLFATAAFGWLVRWLFDGFNIVVRGKNIFEIFAGLIGLAAGIAVFVQAVIWLNASLPAFFAISAGKCSGAWNCYRIVLAQDFKYSGRFFALFASFALWYLLAFLSMGVLIPLVFPYVAMSYILFYKSCAVLNGKDPELPPYLAEQNEQREQKAEQKKNKRKNKKKKKEDAEQTAEKSGQSRADDRDK